MNETRELYVPIKKSFFLMLSKKLTAGEMRTLALLLSYKPSFRIYQKVVAKQQNISTKTVERRFNTYMEEGLITKHYNKSPYFFVWMLGNDAKCFKDIEYKGKNYTLYKLNFILDKNLNDTDWLVLSIILKNSAYYWNYCSDIRQDLSVESEKRSRISKSLSRLKEKGLVEDHLDCYGKKYYLPTEKALNYIITREKTEE